MSNFIAHTHIQTTLGLVYVNIFKVFTKTKLFSISLFLFLIACVFAFHVVFVAASAVESPEVTLCRWRGNKPSINVFCCCCQGWGYCSGLCVYVFVCLFFCLFYIHVCLHQSIFLSIYLLSIYLCIYPSIYQPINIYIYIYRSISLSICLSVCLSLYIYIYVYPSNW